MKALRFLALALTLALAVSLYLAIGEEPTPEFLTVGFLYATLATFALALSFLAEGVNK
jgi:hypothetical protein